MKDLTAADYYNELPDDQKELLEKHLFLVLETNKETNLTRITDPAEARLLHIVDSLAALTELENAPGGLYADLGTGGGFPGIPLAIVTGRSTLLVDSVKKKAAALQTIVDRLGLSRRVELCSARIEDLSVERPNEFAVLTARALTALPSLIELASPLLPIGGQLISYKAAKGEEEVAKSKVAERMVGMTLVSNRTLRLSEDGPERCILVHEKTG